MFKPKYRAEVSASLNALYSKPAVVAALKKLGTSDQPGIPGEKPSWHFFVTQGDHGLFSGSGWTNCLETVLSFCLMYQVTRKYQLLGFQVNGDDGEATVLGHHPHLDQEWTKAALEWGFDANVEKQQLSYRTVSYLQNQFDDIESRSGGVVRGSYPALLAANSAKNPERWISIPNDKATDRQRAMEAVRLIAIGNNCAGNPAFDDIVKFFVRGSPTRCGLDLPDEAWTLTRKALDRLWEHGVPTEEPANQYDEIDIQPGLHATPFFQRMMKLHMDGEL